jgi:hypothetical protein
MPFYLLSHFVLGMPVFSIGFACRSRAAYAEFSSSHLVLDVVAADVVLLEVTRDQRRVKSLVPSAASRICCSPKSLLAKIYWCSRLQIRLHFVTARLAAPGVITAPLFNQP